MRRSVRPSLYGCLNGHHAATNPPPQSSYSTSTTKALHDTNHYYTTTTTTTTMLQPHAEMQPQPTRLGRVLRHMLSGRPLLRLLAAVAVLPSGADGAIAEYEILQLPG